MEDHSVPEGPGSPGAPEDSQANVEEPEGTISSLRSSEEKYRRLFDSIRDSILVANPERRIIALNPAFTSLFGYTLEDLAGKGTVSIYESEAEFLELGNALRENLGSPEFLKVVRYKKKNGEVFLGETNVFYYTDEDGSILGFIGLIRDITQRLAAEEELAETRALLQAALDHSPVGIAIADAPDGRLRYVNQTGLLIRGESAERVVHQVDAEAYVSSWKLLDLDGTPLAPDEVPLARAVLYGEQNSREFIVRRSDEEDRIVRGTAAPIRSEAGDVTSAMVIFDDITERKAAEEALTEKTQLLQESEEALRGLTHRLQAVREDEREKLANDLHDKLGAILTGLYMDLDRLRGEERRGEAMHTGQLSELHSLADEALQFVRDYAAEVRSPVLLLLGLGPAIRDHVERLADRSHPTFQIDVDEGEVELEPDVQINVFRIAQEALTNALRHSEADTVRVTFQHENGGILLEVEDDGKGIPAEKVLASTSLGLLGMRERAMAIGGELWVETPEAGEGTVVRFRLHSGG